MQDQQPGDLEAQAEWAEVKQLQQKQLASQIGLPGLQIEQLSGMSVADSLIISLHNACATLHLHLRHAAHGSCLSPQTVSMHTGAQGGPGHVVWEAGIALSQYFVAHPGKLPQSPSLHQTHELLVHVVYGLGLLRGFARLLTCIYKYQRRPVFGLYCVTLSASSCACGHAELVRGQKILELGSGTGIVGITLASLGAQVTLTDTAGLLPLLQSNLNQNLHSISAASGSAVAAALDWNDLTIAACLLSAAYDGIVGSDLIYSAKDIGPLTNTIQHLQQHSTSAFVTVAHKNRSQVVTDQFFGALKNAGFALHQSWCDGAQSIYSMSL